ncbi:MAG: heme b synthase [Desulfovibrionaceae bacterium]|nr:heme b synthase [Desulfovibrionaceae bacterium]
MEAHHSSLSPNGQVAPSNKLPDGSPVCRLIAWEVTRSCNLACKHCRAEAHPEPYPGELTHQEALDLIDTFPKVGKPIIIFTGGEPTLREDLYSLISHAHSLGLTCACAPNGTRLTLEICQELKKSGVERCSISLDGASAQSHDAFRGVPGAFEKSLQGIQYLKEVGLPFQINTTVTKANLQSFRNIFELCESLGAVAWHIFLLVPMGRAKGLVDQVIDANAYEEVLHWFYDFRKTTSMHLKATCAPHYYRIMRQRAKAENLKVTRETFGLDAFSRGCLGGTGFCFISHTGIVQPCGYLELNCGEIRKTPFPEIWSQSSIFQNLRNPRAYKGKCGVCEYHGFCGGCRARAFSLKGDYLEAEPLCSYEPLSLQREKAHGSA